jgi:glucose/arabinose dehydrogenase/PKD repeat protein
MYARMSLVCNANSMLRRGRRRACAAAVVLAAVLAALPVAPAGAATLPPGFQDTTVISATTGLVHPTVVRFAPDGRVFVAQKSGRIFVYDSLTDTTPTLFADLSAKVHDYWDRGMLGLALDPQFPSRPYVYVLYTYDHILGDTGAPPRWSDACPTPPGPTENGCVASGRLSRLTASGSVMTGPEQVLIEDWCIQYVTHSVGSLNFAPDGSLYVTAGEGASSTFNDYGQVGNPCGDPPGPAGTNLTAPTAEGGALRSQDVRTPSDPTSLHGAVLRVDPDTGLGVAGNPFSGAGANAARIVAYGLRNPFRATFRPGTSELWVGDVGSNLWEEINRMSAPTGANFGWPCYEGANKMPSFDSLNVNLCESLYSAGSGAVVAPFLRYNRNAVVVGEPCPAGGSSVSGLAFGTSATNYPAPYGRALFFGDYTRRCIWAVPTDADGLPVWANTQVLVAGAQWPVDLVIGPGGDLYYVGFESGNVHRITYTQGNQAPLPVARATPTAGGAPLTVQFDGTGSSDPDAGDTISYAWDLDGDGEFDDSSASQPTWTYTQDGTVTARLRVTDTHGASSIDAVTITVGNMKPSAVIETPTPGTLWKVGDVIAYRGSATDTQDGTLAPSALVWTLTMQHCPSTCHAHEIETFNGVSSGNFTAPDHEYPSYLELKLTATDSGGLTDTQTIRLDPRTVNINMASSPTNMTLGLNQTTGRAPFTRTVIQGSRNTISAPNQKNHHFTSWSDGGAQTHDIVANASATYTATFRKR